MQHTIDAVLRSRSLEFGDRTALREKVAGLWRETGHAELWKNAERIAAGLQAQGFKPGDHAALLAPSSPRWLTSFFAILMAGGVVIPVDRELKSAELRHILLDCGARLLFTEKSHLETIQELWPGLPALEGVVLLHAEPTPTQARWAEGVPPLLEELSRILADLELPPDRGARIDEIADRLKRLIPTPEQTGAKAAPEQTGAKAAPEQTGPRVKSWDDLLHRGSPTPSPRQGSDTAVILYTSGTTGRSKGAMLSHANIVANVRGTAEHFNLDDTIHTLSYLPINHVFELVVGVLLPLYMGGRVSFAESLKKMAENLSEVRPTFLLGVPAVYGMLHERIRKRVRSERVSRLLFALPLARRLVTRKIRQAFGSGTIFISGGAALDPAIARGLKECGLTIYQGYGITETSPVIAAEQPGRVRAGSVGHLLPEVELRIEQANDEGVGEILVRGPNVMQGYYRNPEASAEVLCDGWYRTQDLGRLDADGYLFICGRGKNLIVTPNGKNVYPEEVENELMKSPFIAEAMVYGHRVGALAEEVHAVIFPDQAELDDYAQRRGQKAMSVADVERLIREEILAAGKGLADYKRVRRFTLREDEFPKTTTRKIKRYAVEADLFTQ